MSVTIYHNPRCSKSRATLALLEDNNAGATVVEYLTNPPSVDELKNILVLLGMVRTDFCLSRCAAFAYSLVYNLTNLFTSQITDLAEVVELVMANPDISKLGRV